MQSAVRRAAPSATWGRSAPVLLGSAPVATGRRETRPDGTEWVVYRRRVRSAPEVVWSALTDPAQVSRWLGVWRVAGPGRVAFVFAFEGDDLLPVSCSVDEVVPVRRLTVTMAGPAEDDEPERFEVDLRELLGHTEVSVAQAVRTAGAVAHVASGCEFYLDRLVAVLEGRDPSALDFDDYFLQQAEHYRRLFPVQPVQPVQRDGGVLR